MNCLFLDIASHDGILACSDENSVKSSVDLGSAVDDGRLVTEAENLLKEASWSQEDLTHIACVIGPGGFTSLRIAVSFANAMADFLGLPSSGVHQSDIYHARCEEDVLWVHSTKKQELFVRGFGEYESAWPNPKHVMLDDFLHQLPSNVRWMGELIPEHREMMEGKGASSGTLAPLTKVLPEFLSRQTYEKRLISPWYGRGY
jgi:tRNA threonylcarbamoyl adenosine modification protein YeaZ